jgi:hypothetical protein
VTTTHAGRFFHWLSKFEAAFLVFLEHGFHLSYLNSIAFFLLAAAVWDYEKKYAKGFPNHCGRIFFLWLPA